MSEEPRDARTRSKSPQSLSSIASFPGLGATSGLGSTFGYGLGYSYGGATFGYGANGGTYGLGVGGGAGFAVATPCNYGVSRGPAVQRPRTLSPAPNFPGPASLVPPSPGRAAQG